MSSHTLKFFMRHEVEYFWQNRQKIFNHESSLESRDKLKEKLQIALKHQLVFQNEMPLSDLFILGTHNSYNSTSYGIARILAEQKLTIKEQLDLGVRFLMLDVKDCDGELYAVHKYCLENLTKAGRFEIYLKEIRDWMDHHPEETLFVDIENGNAPEYDRTLVTLVNSTMGKFHYKAKSFHTYPPLKDLKGSVLFFLENFRNDEVSQESFYSTFFRYSIPVKESPTFHETDYEYTFFPQYPNNLVDRFRDRKFRPQEFIDKKRKGFLILFEGTNLTIRPGVFQISPEDIEEMMYAGVNIVSLDTIDDSDKSLEKMLASIWTFDPFAPQRENEECTYIDMETLFWEHADCNELKRVACFEFRRGLWETTETTHSGKDAAKACTDLKFEFLEPKTPSDISGIINETSKRKDGIWIHVPSSKQ